MKFKTIRKTSITTGKGKKKLVKRLLEHLHNLCFQMNSEYNKCKLETAKLQFSILGPQGFKDLTGISLTEEDEKSALFDIRLLQELPRDASSFFFVLEQEHPH